MMEPETEFRNLFAELVKSDNGKLPSSQQRITDACLIYCPMQVTAVDSLEGPLLQVEGLGDLRLELHSKKLNIHLVLIDELHRHLYIKSTSRLGHKNKDKNAARVPG